MPKSLIQNVPLKSTHYNKNKASQGPELFIMKFFLTLDCYNQITNVTSAFRLTTITTFNWVLSKLLSSCLSIDTWWRQGSHFFLAPESNKITLVVSAFIWRMAFTSNIHKYRFLGLDPGHRFMLKQCIVDKMTTNAMECQGSTLIWPDMTCIMQLTNSPDT